MIQVEFTLIDGDPLTLFLSNNVAVCPEYYTSEGQDKKGARIKDGVHDQRGWVVTEPYQVVVNSISVKLRGKGGN
jgi:hypothetical protein